MVRFAQRSRGLSTAGFRWNSQGSIPVHRCQVTRCGYASTCKGRGGEHDSGLSCFSRCLERAGMLTSLLLHTKENLHFLTLLAPQETQSLVFRLAWTKLPDQQVECNAHAANLDQSGIVCHAATFTGRRHLSLRKRCKQPKHHDHPSHIMQPPTCTEPPHSKQASFFEEQCNTALHLSLPANTRIHRPHGRLDRENISSPAPTAVMEFLFSPAAATRSGVAFTSFTSSSPIPFLLVL